VRVTDAAVASCCADAYAGAAARYLLGDAFHPGGSHLTRALLGALELPPGATLLDLASGPGTSAVLAARDGDLRVVGVDLSAASVGAARERAEREGLAGRVRFGGPRQSHLPRRAGPPGRPERGPAAGGAGRKVRVLPVLPPTQ
jgi:arsenite methyltransferase